VWQTVKVSWADRHARYTLVFEGFAIALLQHCSSIPAASKLLRLSWHATNEIMSRAVKRGLSRRSNDAIEHIGIDEKCFRAGHQYVTTLNDLKGDRVLEVVETRTTKATMRLLSSLKKSQRKQIKSVSLDFWQPFKSAAKMLLPKADIVHDRFHIS
jgi:transposase